MELQFTKMQGIGNDFVVIDATNQKVEMTPELARQLADRRYGIGCDQILLVEPPTTDEALFRYRIFNADGSEVAQCGNGARCFAQFVRDKGLTEEESFAVETASGIITPTVVKYEVVRVNMGLPRFDPVEIPFKAEKEAMRYPIDVGGETLEIGAVSMGNPHAVLQVDDIEKAPVERLGPLLENHPRFPERTNVGFMQIVEPNRVLLRVWERGAGETLACGSGACAAVAVAQRWGLLDPAVMVDLPGGQLMIERPDLFAPVYMTGPAVTVFEGTIDL